MNNCIEYGRHGVMRCQGSLDGIAGGAPWWIVVLIALIVWAVVEFRRPVYGQSFTLMLMAWTGFLFIVVVGGAITLLSSLPA